MASGCLESSADVLAGEFQRRPAAGIGGNQARRPANSARTPTLHFFNRPGVRVAGSPKILSNQAANRYEGLTYAALLLFAVELNHCTYSSHRVWQVGAGDSAHGRRGKKGEVQLHDRNEPMQPGRTVAG